MESSVVVGVELPVESDGLRRSPEKNLLQVRMLGAMTICQDGRALALPASRKVRVLFAYLALAPRAV